MAITFIAGAESNNLLGWTTVTGSISASSAQANTGTYSYLFDGSGGTVQSDITVSNTTRLSVSIYITSAPSSDAFIFFGTPSVLWSVKVTTDLYVDLYENLTKRYDGTTQLSTGRWYRIALTVNSSDGHAYYWIDGSPEGDSAGTGSSLLINGSNIRFNAYFGIVYYLDDVVCDNTTSSTDDLGDIRVLLAQPNADVANTGYVRSAGAVDYSLLNDDPSESDANKQADYVYYVDKSAVYVEVGYQSCSDLGLSGTDVIDAVNAMVYYKLSKTGDTVPTWALLSGGSSDSVNVTDSDTAVWKNVLDVDAPDEGGWSQTKVDGMSTRFTHASGSSVDDTVYTMWAMVAYHSVGGGGGWGGEYCGVSVAEFDGVTPAEIDGVL